jgi:CheY-like chemotaxis protein
MSNRRSIWIVDDDKIFTVILKTKLLKLASELEICSFADGAQALDLLMKPETRYPEILFLDINMPVIDGWQFLEEFRQLNLSLPEQFSIYISSSSVDHKDMERSKTYHEVKNYVVKPPSDEDLKRILFLP